MQKPEVQFGDWIQEAFELYKENFVLLLVTGIITAVLGGLSMGILSGPLMVGMNMIVLRLIDKTEPKPEIGDVFKGFEFFLQSFLFVLIYGVGLTAANFILGAIPCLGNILAILLPFVANTCVIFVLFLIPEHRMNFWPAVQVSFNTVKQNFLAFLGLSVVASLLAAVGMVACGIGILVTIPMYACIMAVTYRHVFAGDDTVEIEAEPAPAEPTEAAPAPMAEEAPVEPADEPDEAAEAADEKDIQEG